MKIYSQTIDLSKTTPQNFYVPPHSKFKLGVKLVQSVDFTVKLDGAALASDGEIDGFKTFSLESANPGNTTYVVEAVNGQKVKILQTTTNSTVFDVDGVGVSEEYVDGKVQEEATARATADEAIEQKIPTKTSQLANDSGFLTKSGTIDNALSAETANTATTANSANSVPWSGVQSRPTTLEGYGITDAATKAEIPTKTSQLDNDSGYLTHEGTIANAENANTANTANTANSVAWSGVQDKPTSLTGYGITDAATKAEIPTKVSQLTNDSGFLTHEGTIANADNANNANTANTANSVAWSGVQSKPTTLEGYGITDAATKTELDSLAAVVGTANTQLEEIA